jgi:hypothetical protein
MAYVTYPHTFAVREVVTAAVLNAQFAAAKTTVDANWDAAAKLAAFNAFTVGISTPNIDIATGGTGIFWPVGPSSNRPAIQKFAERLLVFLGDDGGEVSAPDGSPFITFSGDLLRFFGSVSHLLIGEISNTHGFNADSKFSVADTQVLGLRRTGWAVATGTATRTTFDTASVTLPLLAQRVKALIDDLHATAGHGLIGT